jgi:acetyl esterase
VTYVPTRLDRVQRGAFAALLALPPALTRRLAGAPHVVDDAPLDAQIQVGLGILSRISGRELDERTVADARATLEQESWLFGGDLADVGSSRDLLVPGPGGAIPARLHLPRRAPGARDPLPLLIWFHGGGWVLGSIESHESVARNLCALAEVAVLNVGYRLAPEHPFPAAFDDAEAAFLWAHEQAAELGVDADRIALGGDSAGGNLSAAVSLARTRAGGPSPAFQLLIVPATDLEGAHPAHELFATGYFLTLANMDWYKDLYLPAGTDRSDPRASPLLAPDLSGLPPAHIAVAGFDPLRDEGVAYAERLRAAGVPVTLRRFRSAVHPFINIPITRMGRAALLETVGALRQGLSVQS